MKTFAKWICAYAIFFIFFVSSSLVMADEPMTVVASPVDQNSAQRWVDYLIQNEVMVEFYLPEQFDSIRTAKYVAIMGGVDNGEIRKLVEDIIGENEVATLLQKGNRKMYLIQGKFAQDQLMLIFTGSDSEAATLARTESRNTWLPLLNEWFELDQGPAGLKAY